MILLNPLKSLLIVFSIVVCCSTTSSIAPASQALPAQTSRSSLLPAWERTLAARITGIGVSSTGRCVAVSTSENIVVIDTAGRELWRWDFSKGNRFVTAEKISVAPKCDWVALVGNPDYRYIWIVHQNGRRIPIKSEGTPLSVDISHAGNGMAIGTGAGLLFLYSSNGTLKWKLNRGAVLPVDEVSFSNDDSTIMISGYGQSIVSAAGKMLWSGGAGVGSMRAASDFKTFVSWGGPPHGPGIGWMSLLDKAGKVMWTKVSSDPQAIISPLGDLIIAQTNDNQDPSEEDGYNVERPKALRLLSRSGNVVRTFSAHGRPVAFSTGGQSFILDDGTGFVALDLDETQLWRIEKAGSVHIVSSPDFGAVVVSQENRVSWYSLSSTSKP
jgi:hypothetical protein